VVGIASIGCGPAREVMDYLESHRPQTPVRFTLVDHDREALEFASGNVRGTSAVRDGRVEVHPLRVSVLNLIGDRSGSPSRASQHMIYCVGLLDYFGARVCRRLAGALFDLVTPGGLLVIGNMKAHTNILWPFDFLADWSLNYRTAEDMLALADLADASSVELHTEATGCDYLLFVRKKGRAHTRVCQHFS
jgi:extracellular factor (EF) 3-hydroxypalmitic acid methyl ester biosynthesis protein